jgi:hypothetical protein
MSRRRIDAVAITLGALLLVVGSLLGWATLRGRSISGVEGGDGWMTIVAAVVAGAFGVRLFLADTELPLWLAWAGLLAAIGIAGVNLLDILDTGGEDVAVGGGMLLMIVGGFVGVVGLTDYSLPAWREYRRTKWPASD